MQEKEMISDYLAGLDASLAKYGGIIAETENEELRRTIQTLRNQDEARQFALSQKAKEKGYYIPAQPASSSEIATVKQQLSQG
ncbi:spore coat protein [Clostridium sp.]|uniref:spore coat protein n=1 Tax=Clostridium sp. TaxID=1506 RepID=UPI003216830E